jgi:hypothetical protein
MRCPVSVRTSSWKRSPPASKASLRTQAKHRRGIEDLVRVEAENVFARDTEKAPALLQRPGPRGRRR